MKKFINVFIIAFLMMFAFSVNSNAQTYAYRGFQAAYKYVENGRWTD